MTTQPDPYEVVVDVLADILLLAEDAKTKEDVVALVRGSYDAAVRMVKEKGRGNVSEGSVRR